MFCWFAGDEKTRQMAIVFTQQTVLPTARNHLSNFVLLPHVRRTRVDFSGADLIKSAPRICNCTDSIHTTSIRYLFGRCQIDTIRSVIQKSKGLLSVSCVLRNESKLSFRNRPRLPNAYAFVRLLLMESVKYRVPP